MADTITEIDGIPFLELEFNKQARLERPEQADAIVSAVRAANGPRELIVISHGWNNDMSEARALYRELLGNVVADLRSDGTLARRRFAIVGVLWPSKRFADKELIAGGAAAAANEAQADAELLELIGQLEELTGESLATARAEAPNLKTSAEARRKFVDDVLAKLPQDVSDAEDDTRKADVLAESRKPEFLQQLGTPVVAAPPIGGGGAAGGIGGGGLQGPAGGAAGIGDFFSGIKGGAMNLLNLTTYYVMKERAGTIGRDGLYPVLVRVRQAAPQTRLHMIGHSFGARVVTAAAAGRDGEPPLTIDSLSLLQAAFSHFSFAQGWDDAKRKDGTFRRLIAQPGARLGGPMVVTHSRHDFPVGVAYAIASRIKGQIAAGVGDKNDPFGGLGGNGALKTPEAQQLKLHANNEPYAFRPGVIYNLNANGTKGQPGVITGHGDVRRVEVAHAVADAVRAT